MGYVIAVAEFVAGLGGAVTGVPSGPPASLALILARRAHRRALDRPRALGGARAGGARPRALGRARPAGHDDRRHRPALRHPRRRRAACCRATRATATPRKPGSEDDGDLATQAEAYARGSLVRRSNRIEAEVPGLGRLVYVGSPGRRGSGGALRRGGDPDRAELVRPRRTAAASSSGGTGCAATGRWRSGSRPTASRWRAPARPTAPARGPRVRRSRRSGWRVSRVGAGTPAAARDVQIYGIRARATGCACSFRRLFSGLIQNSPRCPGRAQSPTANAASQPRGNTPRNVRVACCPLTRSDARGHV